MQMTITRAGTTGMRLCTLLVLAACGSNHAPEELNQMPGYLGTITRADYDGKTNDLLTAGLGKTGLEIYRRASGQDEREVEPYTDAKSESAEHTFDEDSADYSTTCDEL